MLYPFLSKAVEGYLLSVGASGRSTNTIRNYRQELNRLVHWGGDQPVNELTSQHLEKYLLYLKEDFRITHSATTPIKPRKLSQKSISNAWSTLSSFCKWVSREYQLANPFHLAPVKTYSKPIYPLSEAEIEKLLLACKSIQKHPQQRKSYDSSRSTYKRDKALLLMLLDTGVRVSELCGVNVSDIDLSTGRIVVTGKGNKTRFVYLGKVTRQAVWQYLSDRFPKGAPPKDEPVFVDNMNIHRLTRFGVLLLLKRLGGRVGIENVHPHRFRHTFAIEFLKNGGNVFELQQLLGHTELEMVRRYVQLAQLDLEMIARRASPADNWRLR